MSPGDARDPEAQARRRIVMRATLYMYGFLTAAIVVALGGAALIAWFASRRGFPFLQTWLVLSMIILLPSLLMLVWRAVKERSGKG